MRKMSLEERKKWYEDHLEQIASRVWHATIESEIHGAKVAGCDEIIPNDYYLKIIIFTAESLICQEYYGAPITEQTLCKQEWLGCDLTELHSEIKDNGYETAIHCLIKDEKIIKSFYSKGSFDNVKIAYSFDDIIKEAKELKADGIYHVHNHPASLVAWPGSFDMIMKSKEEAKALEAGLKYNYGVVSCEDYWDYVQVNLPDEEVVRRDKERFNKEAKAAEGKELTSAEVARKLKETAENQ